MRAFISALLVSAAAVSGLPVNDSNNGIDWLQYEPDSLRLIHTSVVDNTTMYWFGDEGTQPEAAVPQERSATMACGSNNIICHNSHTAKYQGCLDLLLGLGQVRGSQIPYAPRAICAFGCCVSWSAPVSGFISHFGDAAIATYNTCLRLADGDYIPGLSRNTNIGGKCVTQCLSNRAKGCTD